MEIFNIIFCALIKVFNILTRHVLQTIVDILTWVIDLFPESPLPDTIIQWGDFGKSIGYFLPIGTFIQHFTFMLGLVILWYAYEYILRMFRMIR